MPGYNQPPVKEQYQELNGILREEVLALSPEDSPPLFVSNRVQRSLAYLVGLDGNRRRDVTVTPDGEIQGAVRIVDSAGAEAGVQGSSGDGLAVRLHDHQGVGITTGVGNNLRVESAQHANNHLKSARGSATDSWGEAISDTVEAAFVDVQAWNNDLLVRFSTPDEAPTGDIKVVAGGGRRIWIRANKVEVTNETDGSTADYEIIMVR